MEVRIDRLTLWNASLFSVRCALSVSSSLKIRVPFGFLFSTVPPSFGFPNRDPNLENYPNRGPGS